jgi:hypothetical protein
MQIAQVSTISISYFLLFGAVGGLLPDIDMLFVHRKTLHYPVVFSILTSILMLLYILTRSDILLIFTVLILAAAIHCLMDMLGGGKEMRPWRETDDRAVYNHIRQRWIEPLRLFYDGSLPDLFISITSAVLILLFDSVRIDFWIALLIALAIIYTLFRRIVTRWIPDDYLTFSSYIQDKVI